MRAAKAAGDAKRARNFLKLAIQHYERGMAIDLNDYFPVSNLARLYRERGLPDDEARAQRAVHVTVAGCERALARGASESWLRATLLGAHFDAPDPRKAEELLDQISLAGPAAWKLDTTLISLEESLVHVADPAVRKRLEAVLGSLRELASNG